MQVKLSKRYKVCVICSTKWVIEYDKSKPLVEFITCPTHRAKAVDKA